MTGLIPPDQLRALETLAPALEEGTYLARGVAVATALRHRLSRDLDLFVPHDFDSERLEESLAARVPGIRTVGRARGTLHLELNGIPISILSYRYPLLVQPERKTGVPVPVASLEDLACMKISAIAGRGAAKDFWDLHEMLSHGLAGGSLAHTLDLYSRKFPAEDVGHAIRSMAYFADADAAPLPLGLSDEHWREIKVAFAKRVKEL
jgi:hypothetical protein